MALTLLSPFLARVAFAEEGYDAISGADRSFTVGYYNQAQEVQRFKETFLERDAKETVLAETAEAGVSDEKQRLRVYRSFRVGTLYDSNLFYDRTDPKDDLLMLYTASLGYRLGKQGVTRAHLDTFYDLTYVNYTENSKLSRFNQTHTVSMGLRGEKLEIRIQNKFQPASARETGERTELASSNSNRVIAYSDSAAVNLTYHWTSKTDLSADYNYNITYFPASSNENNRTVTRFSFQENSLSPRVSYQLSSKTSLYGTGRVSGTDYFKNGDLASKYYLVATGIRYRLTNKTDIGFELGYDWRDYNLPIYGSSEGPRFTGIIRREFTKKIAATILASRSTGEAFDTTGSAEENSSFKTLSTSYRMDLAWNANDHMILSAFTSIEDSEQDGLYSMVDPENPSLTFTRALEDQTYRWGLSLKYQPRTAWSYFLSYEFLNRFSSFKNFQYDGQKIAGSAKVSF